MPLPPHRHQPSTICPRSCRRYNAAVCAWEPLVESCRLRVGASLQDTDRGYYEKQVRVEAPRACNFNFSSPMCELLSQSVLTLADDITGKVALRDDEDGPFVPYAISNQVGVPLRYGRARGGAPEAVLVPEAQEAFDFWPEATSEVCPTRTRTQPFTPPRLSKRLSKRDRLS